MEYELAWGTAHPGLLLYLVDLSGSMAYDDKIRRVSNIIWNVVDCLTANCQDDGKYKERYYLKVIGYNQYTYDLFSGGVSCINDWLDKHSDEQFINIKENAKPQGLTYMSIAFEKAAEEIKKWKEEQIKKWDEDKNKEEKYIPAPIVINITDGFPEEKGLTEQQSRDKALLAANALRAISVPDGNVLLFNIHIDGKAGKEKELMFPAVRPSDVRRGFLFDASSEMTSTFILRAQRQNLPATTGSKFMVSNISDMRMLARLVTFGSSVSGMPNIDSRTEIPID